MAKNIVMGGINQPISVVEMSVTVPATNTTTGVPASGAACLATRIPGVAERAVDADTGLTSLNTNCVAEFIVEGVDASGVSSADANVAVAAGDLVYIGADGVLSKRATGTPFGTAFGNAIGANGFNDVRTGQLVASGNKATKIRVWVGKIN